ncbi:hypothetical protein AN639_03855 [Candidatus Epulonipiscium fishelsonii]|uniref:Uncharacterized protein n=1 Tax=Candidatus Epulonipiscium fishelsonii TaxID=77094 RepID=A0ACC8XAM4_9FIRM|nr:hypothetical protein AN396_08525 [Epulopiscium sp. SCG-B11WGA-EpuloA1]ONI41195.1 hypothetical protein AN639_03855 [Epulopiscium sp. SCG-B05WGA-EpuloA1]
MIEYLRFTNAFNENWEFTLNIIDDVAKIILSTKDKDFRVDTNLDNFIICKDKLILVDCFPPIYVSKFEEIKTGEFNFLKPLFIDITVQFIAFMGYVFSNLTRNESFMLDEQNNKQKVYDCYISLDRYLKVINSNTHKASKIGDLLNKRLQCFIDYFNDKYDYSELQLQIKKIFNHKSVRNIIRKDS